MNLKWSAEQVRRMQELRRSNAAGFLPSKKKYKRKKKHSHTSDD